MSERVNEASWHTGAPREATDEEIRELFGDDPRVWAYILYMSPWQKDVVLSASRRPRTTSERLAP